MSAIDTLSKYGLTPQTYEELMDKCQDKVDKLIDLDWSEILGEYGIKLNPDTLRKAVQPPIFGGSFVRQYYKELEESNSDLEKNSGLESQIRRLEEAKTQYRDWHNAFNEQNRTNARVEQKLDYLQETLNNIGEEILLKEICPKQNGTTDKEMLIMLSDWHIGAEYYRFSGCFNEGIAQERLCQLMGEIFKIKRTHDVSKCKVVMLGDFINGNIHQRIKVTNRINVIEQIKECVALLTTFCESLCAVFETVELHDVCGNHTRIDRKDDALHDERLDSLVSWSVANLLNHKANFEYVNPAFTTDIDIIDVCGKNYVAVHGDYDSFSKSGVSDLTMMLGFKPYAILFGHMHTCAYDEVSDIKMVRGGCLSGTGDDYTLERRLRNKASQMVLVCDKNGIKCAYPITLD